MFKTYVFKPTNLSLHLSPRSSPCAVRFSSNAVAIGIPMLATAGRCTSNLLEVGAKECSVDTKIVFLLHKDRAFIRE